MPSLAGNSALFRALPFWISILFVPFAIIGAVNGGWWLAIIPIYGWVVLSILDAISGLNLGNMDPETPESELYWYRTLTMLWFPIQFCLVFGGIYAVTISGHLSLGEKFALMFGIGVVGGTIGIVYAHELMHQKNRLERRLGDGLMAMTLYGHFRTEHLLVHHRYVGTPRDPVTARYNEGFLRFFPRILIGCAKSAWRAEAAMLARKGHHVWHISNPFWQYGAAQAALIALAFSIGGWAGVGFFAFQALVAVWQLELVNYVEHYGLTRKHLGEGKYEHVQPRHSWNAAHRMSNYLLINLQRHSDHHYKPDRRFPLLQNHAEDHAPQLPHGYPVMTALAMVPPLWRRVMNPKVRAWRKKYYPEIDDWVPYKLGQLPMPKGAS